MQKIILQDGKVIEVDIPIGEEDDYFRGLQKAVMIDDCFMLKDVFVYEFIRVDHNGKSEMEFADYFYSEKELTNEQVIYQMMKRDMGRYDIVITHKALMLGDREE